MNEPRDRATAKGHGGTPQAPAPLLVVQGLRRRLGDRLLWDQLSLTLQPGDRVGLVGPSGCGKTLLLRSLALLDPLQGGRILLQGQPPAAWSLPRYRSRVMLVTQRPVAFAGTVEQNLRESCRYGGDPPRPFQRQQLLEWLEQLGRPASFLEQPAAQLSGGESQLLALLRALQRDPLVLLLDEPSASLDAASTTRVEQLLGCWLQAGAHAYLLTSHDARQIQRLCDRRLELGVPPAGGAR